MEIIEFSDVAAFAERVRPLLAHDQALHSLALGILGQLENGRHTDPSLWTVESSNGTRGCILRMPPGPWTVCSRETHQSVFASVVANHLANHAPLPGKIHGHHELVWSIATRWAAQVGGSVTPLMRLRVMDCREVKPAMPVRGGARPIQPGNVGRVALLLRDFEAEIGLTATHASLEESRESMRREVRRGHSPIWTWEVDHRIVSIAGISRQAGTGERVGPVFTPQEQRGKGYASALVSELTRHAFARGCEHVFLFADADNARSNALYERLGFRHVGDADIVVVGGPSPE